MRRTWKKLLLGVVIGTFAVYFIALMVTTKRVSAFPPLPDPNGYDDFLKAAAALNSDNLDVMYTNDPVALREFMIAAAESLRLVRLGLTRTCSVPTADSVMNFTNRLSDLANMKKLAQLLANEGRLAESEGRTNDALKCYVEGIQYGNEISRGGFIIHRLVGIACEAIADTCLTRVLPTLSCDQSRPLIKRLEEIDLNAVTWDHISRNEGAFARFEMKKSINPVIWVVGWWQSRDAIKKSKMRHEQISARRRLLMLELAIRCYQSESGRSPASLDDLVPKYLARIPEDPFTGKPLVYRPQGTNWIAYSIGPDGVDDGGVPAVKAPPGTSGAKKGDLFYYTP